MSAGGQPPQPFPSPPLPAAGTALPGRSPAGGAGPAGSAAPAPCPAGRRARTRGAQGMPRYIPPPELPVSPGRAVRDLRAGAGSILAPRRILWQGAILQPRGCAAEPLRPSEYREVTLRAVPAGSDSRGSAVAPGSVPRPWQGCLCRAHVTCRDVTCQASAGVSV